jgi:hypothetical protein
VKSYRAQTLFRKSNHARSYGNCAYVEEVSGNVVKDVNVEISSDAVTRSGRIEWRDGLEVLSGGWWMARAAADIFAKSDALLATPEASTAQLLNPP